jgi:hypothetical protein
MPLLEHLKVFVACVTCMWLTNNTHTVHDSSNAHVMAVVYILSKSRSQIRCMAGTKQPCSKMVLQKHAWYGMAKVARELLAYTEKWTITCSFANLILKVGRTHSTRWNQIATRNWYDSARNQMCFRICHCRHGTRSLHGHVPLLHHPSKNHGARFLLTLVRSRWVLSRNRKDTPYFARGQIMAIITASVVDLFCLYTTLLKPISCMGFLIQILCAMNCIGPPFDKWRLNLAWSHIRPLMQYANSLLPKYTIVSRSIILRWFYSRLELAACLFPIDTLNSKSQSRYSAPCSKDFWNSFPPILWSCTLWMDEGY